MWVASGVRGGVLYPLGLCASPTGVSTVEALKVLTRVYKVGLDFLGCLRPSPMNFTLCFLFIFTLPFNGHIQTVPCIRNQTLRFFKRTLSWVMKTMWGFESFN